MKTKPIVHKTYPSWTTTECDRLIDPQYVDNPPKTSYRWKDVTCKRCLRNRRPYRRYYSPIATLRRIARLGGKEGVEEGVLVMRDGTWAAITARRALKDSGY